MTDLAPLLDSPALPEVVRQLQETLDAEAGARARFFDDLSPDEKGEFINGHVIMSSPARDSHTSTVGRIVKLLDTYAQVHSLGIVRFEKSLVALTRNDYEPDAAFWTTESAREVTGDTLRYPAPDLAVEVLSPKTEKRDRGVKFEDYAAHGVDEYWIVDAKAETVEQYLLDGDAYALSMKSGTGDLASQAVPGFVIPVRAVFDDQANLSALRTVLS